MSPIPDSFTRAGLSPPKIVTIMITRGCNLSCVHCWPDSPSRGKITVVPPARLRKLIRESVLMGAEEVCLTGGEPLTHPDWLELVSFACGLRGLNRVILQTNAVLLADADARALASLNFSGLSVQVSLEGVRAETHDLVRGAGTFEKALRGIELLVSVGLGPRVVVEFTEMEHNFGELPRLLKLLDRLGVGGLVSGTLVMGGRAAKSGRVRPPTAWQYRDLLRLYESDPSFKRRYERVGNIAALEWLRGRLHPSPQECTCVERPYIDTEGRIYPCIMLPIEGLAGRGAYDRSLEGAMKDALPLWAGLPALNRRRSRELDRCKGCPGRRHCRGGCMGRAYAATGDFMNVEDRCELRRAVYGWERMTDFGTWRKSAVCASRSETLWKRRTTL